MSWLAAAVVGGAVVGGVASTMAAGKQSSAIEAGAQSQAAATMQSTQMQLDYLRETDENIAAAVEQGLIDLDTGFNMAIQQLQPMTGMEEYNAARGLLQDPSSVMDRPSVQWQYDQGIDAMQSAFSVSSGGGISGQGLAAAQKYGQNLASTALDAELNRLFPFINISNQARSQIAGVEAGRGQMAANLRVGGATKTAQITGQAIPGIAQGIQSQGDIAAAAGINQANVYANNMSNMANLGSGALNYFATNQNLFSQTPAPVASNPWITTQNPLGLTPGQGL